MSIEIAKNHQINSKKKMKYITFNNYYNFFQTFVVFLFLFLGSTTLDAQLKVGSNPKMLAPNVLLEVEATSGNPAVFSKDSAYLGIGTLTPTRRLDIQSPSAGAVKIVDGTQGTGKLLTSDANGVAKWNAPANMINSNGILISGGTGAVLSAVFLRLDSSAVAKMIVQSPSKDSILSVLNSAINTSTGIVGKSIASGNLISVLNGNGAALKDNSISVDTQALKSYIAQRFNYTPISDSLRSFIANNISNSNVIVANVVATVPALSIGDVGSITLSVAGAAVGNNVVINPTADLPNGMAIAYSRVSAANTVKVGFLGTGSSSSFSTSFDIRIFK